MLTKKLLLLTASFAAVGLAGLFAPSAPEGIAIPRYHPVKDWPQLPAQSKFGDVIAVATDAADRVYVFHRGKQPIMVFDRDGKFQRAWGDDRVDTAHGLRIDSAGNVWITDIGTHQVTKFNSNGKVLLTLGKKDEPGEGQDQFNEPADVAIAPSGEIYVADGYGNSRVVKFAKDGKYLKEWGKRGEGPQAGPGQFHVPHSICFDSGQVYVADRQNYRIQIFDAEGQYLTEWRDGGMPFGLTFIGERLFVADGAQNWITVFDKGGKALGRFGSDGTGPGQFRMAHAMCADSQGAIYVADALFGRVQKFEKK